MKLKIKETYLILLIVISLISLGVYSTYALFTASTTIDDVVGITATLDIGKSISEYEIVSVGVGETKLIELNVVNSSSNTIYYGAWYKIVEGNSLDIDIGLYTEINDNSSSGILTSSSSINLLVGITNNSDTTITVYLGVKGSNTNELNLGSDKTLLPTGWTDVLLVTDEVLEQYKVITSGTEEVNKTYSYTGSVQTDVLEPGTYKLEVWGAQGGTNNSSYAVGGKAGYSYGTLILIERTTLYFYIGGQGNGTTGGFNGGGTTNIGGGGGGATDVRINVNNLYSRVIVAGGGGGGCYTIDSSGRGTYTAEGGAGGGESGINGTYSSSILNGTYSGTSGTQISSGTSGGIFGSGANAEKTYTVSGPTGSLAASGGGGGGWYGGGSGGSYNSSVGPFAASGGGGSGWVYTEDTFNTWQAGNSTDAANWLLNSSYYLTNAATVAGNTSFTDYDGSTVTGHSGNGYAKITGTSQVTVESYTIPQLKGLTTLNISYGQSVDLTSDVELICENNQTTGCSITSTSITDTSTLSAGTYTVTYKVTGTNNKKYLFNRTINVLTNLDTSGANSPDLVDGLIPVMHNGSSWVVADYTNSDSEYQWYDYNNKKWANAALVTETKRNSLNKDSNGNYIAGQTIGDTYSDGTLAFYVWIPRYKYKVWNINKIVGTDSYNAQTEGIDIVFENEKSSTGTISCTYSYASASSTAGSPNESCTGKNGDYYTHPAFTFGSDELRGFWIGKYEVSSSNSSANYGGGNVTNLQVRILPNVNSWIYNTVSNFNTVIQNMQVSSNIYGLSTSRTNTDSHMLTNMEWGAVAYLTNSNYGRCTNGSCTEVTINNCSNFITGIGADSVSASSSSTTCTTNANKYNGTKGVLASTTGNITGVYDMSGGAWDYVMSNMSSATGRYTFYPSSSGFASSWYSSNSKYITTYAYGTNELDQSAYNRSRLGDATGEVVLTASAGGSWNGDYAYFTFSSNSWFDRGGAYNDATYAGIFGFNDYTGGVYSNFSTRAALISLSN